MIRKKSFGMTVAGHLQRVVTIRIYTLVGIFVLPFILMSLHGWTHCQVESLYGYDPKIERDQQHVVRVETSNIKRPSNTVEVAKKQKTILYWTKMFTSDNFYFGDGEVFKGCPVWSCMGTNDRTYQPVEKFDVIMFHGPEINVDDLPEKRSPHQRYIFMDSETQDFHPIKNEPDLKYFFNWTMAYRRDADIMRPYVVFKHITSNEVLPPYIPTQWVNISNAVIPESTHFTFRNKTKMVAWFVSHCSTDSKREKVAEKLKDYVEVDIYGSCGELECPRKNAIDCYKKLESEYFFYLSFENSMCRDYITEKVVEILKYNVIPIVYGAADYESFLPPNSYINVLDFSSMKKLAEYLVELTHDEEKYLSYFKWKSFYKVEKSRRYIICQFCKVLHEPHRPNQIIKDIYDWWVTGSQCTLPPKID